MFFFFHEYLNKVENSKTYDLFRHLWLLIEEPTDHYWTWRQRRRRISINIVINLFLVPEEHSLDLAAVSFTPITQSTVWMCLLEGGCWTYMAPWCLGGRSGSGGGRGWVLVTWSLWLLRWRVEGGWRMGFLRPGPTTKPDGAQNMPPSLLAVACVQRKQGNLRDMYNSFCWP